MRRFLACAACFAMTTAIARADKLLVATGGGNPVTLNDVKVLRVEEGKVYFRQLSGEETRRDLEQVVMAVVEDEVGFNAAEEAFYKKDFTTAADAYAKAVKVSDKQWIKDRSAARLLESATQISRFDIATGAWAYLVNRDAKGAMKFKPAVPANSANLDGAVSEVNKAVAGAKDDSTKAILLSQLIEIHRARKDNKAVAETIDQLSKLSPETLLNDPSLSRALVEMKLTSARVALDEKKYQRAMDEINKSRDKFTEPAQQAEALWILAESQRGLGGEIKDPGALKDLALQYMRVVSVAKDVSAKPHQADALFITAELLEKAGETKDATALYQQIAADGTSPNAAKAKSALTRLSPEK